MGLDYDLLHRAFWPLVKGALLGTIPLSLLSFALGLTVAVLIALMRISRHRSLSAPARAYVSVVRGTPLLVQLLVIFYGLPELGVTLDPWPTAILAFSVNVGGYAAEVVRAAILSVPRGQWEAAHMVGMTRTLTLRRIILPQAARVSVPPLSNTFISLVKDTSLASLVLVGEMFRRGQEIAAQSSQFLLIYIEAAAIYWAISLMLSAAQSRLETRLERHAV